MSTDRELVEMAAKASGRDGDWVDFAGMDIRVGYQGGLLCGDADGYYWNPLKDDGDALRLAVDLRMSISYGLRENTVYVGTAESAPWQEVALSEQGIPAATRRAIVCAAAEIGRSVP